MQNIEKQNYAQIINYLDSHKVVKNEMIYNALITRLSKWDKALMHRRRFDYIGNIHLKNFKPYFGALTLQFLNDVQCIDIPEYEFLISNNNPENYAMISSIFQSMKHWKILYSKW